MAFPFSGYLDGVPYATIPLGTTVVNVTSSATLTTALSNAVAGQRIMLANGTYSGAFTIAKTGTAGAGISIEASTTGGAVFASGTTFLVNNSAYVTLKGLSFPFENGSGNVIGFRGSSHHCRVTRCLFGPTSLGTAGTTKASFVYGGDDVNHIRVDHNEIRFKTNPGNAILFDGNFTTSQTCQHIRIDHNHIHDIKPEVSNEKEPIRLGVSTMSKTFGYSVIERNVFVACIAEPEIVSIKSCGNRMSGNTFLRCIGGPVYRHGTNGVVTDNYIVDDGTSAPPPPDPAGTYRWFKFAPTALRAGPDVDAVQLSEFAILNGTTRLTGMTITATNNNSPVGEEPAKAGDNSTATKWLSFNKTASELVYNFPSLVMATGYRWATGDDLPDRDPISWTVHGSVDGSSYTLLDTRTNYATPATRTLFLPDFGFGGAGGVLPPSGQTLGVGGVATPPGAILATSDQPGTQLNITTSGTAGAQRVYDGQGHRIGQIKIRASYVTVQNYRIEAQQQYGVDAKLGGGTGNHHVIIQNNDIKDLRPSGDGDLNGMTINGNNIIIAYNTAIMMVGVESPGSHTDFCQTWNDGPGDESTSNLWVIGNHVEGVKDGTSSDKNVIHQFVIGEGKDSTDGGGGGDGVSQNWFIADNYTTADCKFDDIDNVTYTRNNFAGIDKRAVVVTSLSSGFKYYSDNVVTGTTTVEVGAPIIPGGGPATPTW